MFISKQFIEEKYNAHKHPEGAIGIPLMYPKKYLDMMVKQLNAIVVRLMKSLSVSLKSTTDYQIEFDNNLFNLRNIHKAPGWLGAPYALIKGPKIIVNFESEDVDGEIIFKKLEGVIVKKTLPLFNNKNGWQYIKDRKRLIVYTDDSHLGSVFGNDIRYLVKQEKSMGLSTGKNYRVTVGSFNISRENMNGFNMEVRIPISLIKGLFGNV